MPERRATVSPISGWLMIVGGAALALFTFLPWYEIGTADLHAWEALRRTDVIIFGAGLVAAACGTWLVFGRVGHGGRIIAALGTAAAAVGALVVFLRMISPPGDADLKVGIFLALIAAAVAAVAGLMALASAMSASRPAGGE